MGRTLERFLLVGGLVLVSIFVLAKLDGRLRSRIALASFQADATDAATTTPGASNSSDVTRVDYALWSEKRIHAYKTSLLGHFPQPLAVLRVEKIGLEVPVFPGTDDLTLNRGVGSIVGSAPPGPTGNVGIAGHRDGFFRGLKDVSLGDRLKLATKSGEFTYVIDNIVIVKPTDVFVLAPRPSPSVTLVTCYPFYFVGDAPQRYIVRAELADVIHAPE